MMADEEGPEPTEAELWEMRQYGWTSTSDDDWFMPPGRGIVRRHVVVEGDDGKVSSTQVPCGLRAAEAWKLHRDYFRIFHKRRS